VIYDRASVAALNGCFIYGSTSRFFAAQKKGAGDRIPGALSFKTTR
jgi:hypothetical protein